MAASNPSKRRAEAMTTAGRAAGRATLRSGLQLLHWQCGGGGGAMAWMPPGAASAVRSAASSHDRGADEQADCAAGCLQGREGGLHNHMGRT